MLVLGVVFVKIRKPFPGRRHDLIAGTRPQLDPRPITHAVLGFLEEVEQFVDRGPGNRGRLEQRPPLVSDTVDAAMDAVAVLVVAPDAVAASPAVALTAVPARPPPSLPSLSSLPEAP